MKLADSKNIGMIIAGGVGARLTSKMPKQYIKGMRNRTSSMHAAAGAL